MALVTLQTGKFPKEEYKITKDQVKYLRKIIQTMQEENEEIASVVEERNFEKPDQNLAPRTFQQLLLDEK